MRFQKRASLLALLAGASIAVASSEDAAAGGDAATDVLSLTKDSFKTSVEPEVSLPSSFFSGCLPFSVAALSLFGDEIDSC